MGERYSLKAVRTSKKERRDRQTDRKKKKKKKKKKRNKQKSIPFRDNLLWSIRTIPDPIQFMLGAISPIGSRYEQGHITIAKEMNPEKVGFCCLIASRISYIYIYI